MGMQALDLAETARSLAFVLIPMILSLSVHECAHAAAAYLLGDRTAKDAGRLTLNPQVHVDPWGTLFVPALCVLMGGAPFLGWARPTPFRPTELRAGVSPRLGVLLVAIAGPLSNVALALVAISLLALLHRAGIPLQERAEVAAGRPTSIFVFLFTMFELNLGLAFINLLPVPPLDGYRLLPKALDRYKPQLERFGFAILMGAFLLLPPSLLEPAFRPLYFVMDRAASIFGLG